MSAALGNLTNLNLHSFARLLQNAQFMIASMIYDMRRIPWAFCKTPYS